MKGKNVVEIECGSSHSACILDDGSLYTWGKGRYGRLGHNDYETLYKPKQVKLNRRIDPKENIAVCMLIFTQSNVAHVSKLNYRP